jgi:dihydroflavonol-4-reductase
VRVVVTGGAGFIGQTVVRVLLARGDHVVALVRDPGRAGRLQALGCETVASDLGNGGALVPLLAGADAVIHGAGSYRVGIQPSERPAMWDANVGTTERVLDAAIEAGVPRIVYISTVNVFGNTHGRVVDESYRRDLSEGFLSSYDETKYRAHEVALDRVAAGAQVVIVMPSQVYGPRDHSGIGEQLRLAHEGKLPYRALDDLGIGLVHVDDLAAGIVAALDRGRLGESYILSGPTVTLAAAMGLAARLGGRSLPRIRVPTVLLRALSPFGRLVGQANLREVISAADGVTYWASSTKAEAELDFRTRSIDDGLRDTFATAAIGQDP